MHKYLVCWMLLLVSDIGLVNAQTLATKIINLNSAAEVGAEITARAPGASWERAGAEAAALTITVDGKYNQDLMLWNGDREFTYRILLGKLAKGRHTIAARLNAARSARAAQNAEISLLRPQIISASAGDAATDADDLLAIAHAPVLYARANTIDRFTDLPLAMYYEVLRDGNDGAKVIRYTTIFTNEDGGTPTVALMARWGRTTDIEWTYEMRLQRAGNVAAETYQGVAHETKSFTGERTNGAHPLLAVASDNNNFSDLACSAVRYAPWPVRARLEHATRESMMDAQPAIHRVMIEELRRENRIATQNTSAATTTGVNAIADPRDYLYLDAHGEQQGAALAFEIQLDGGDAQQQQQTFRTDLGDARLRIDRSGNFRTAVRLPAGTDAGKITAITARCYPTAKESAQRACRNVNLDHAMMLERDFTPRELPLVAMPEKSLAPGETIAYRLQRQGTQ